MAVARRELSDRGWKDMRVTDSQKVKDHWEILVWRVPATPGGFALVTVSDDLKVVSVSPGL